MNKKTEDAFFDSIDYAGIVDNIKGIFTSDGAMATLLDFERVLDEADLYAFRNWELGELVSGPDVKRYTVGCVFMYPYKLMPDPRGAKRLISIGCSLKFKHTKIKVPVQVKTPDDMMDAGNYPKSASKEVWLIQIVVPKEIMDDIREGSVDLADQTIDLQELDDAYDDDLDTEDTGEDDEGAGNDMMGDFNAPAAPVPGPGGGMPPAPGGMM